MSASENHPAVRQKMDIPFYKEGKEKPSLFSASDRNVEVALQRALANITIERGEQDQVLYSDLGIKLVIAAGDAPAATGGPLDQAVYAARPGGATAIYGVRGGYVSTFDTTGKRLRIARFASPSFGCSSICYDSVNDKVICSYWNDGRANDGGFIEPTDQKGLYKINADTLATELYVSTSGEAAPNLATAMQDGPRDLQFYNGFIYAVIFGSKPGFSTDNQIFLAEIDPVTLIIGRVRTTDGMAGLTVGTPFPCLAVDAAHGKLWQTSSGDTAIASLDFATFTGLTNYFTSNTIFTPTGIDLGTLAPGIDGAVYNWAGGPFANGAYIITYLSGALAIAGGSNWTLNLGTPNIPAIEFDPAINGVYNRFNAIPLAVGLFNSSAACQAASAGNFKFIYGSGQIGLSVNFFDGTGHNLGPGAVYSYDPQPVFSLYQVGTYSTSGVNYPPYGICVVPDFNRIIVTGRSRFLEVFDLGSLSFASTFDIGDSAALPYRVRYNPADKLVYIPTLTSNSVVSMDPNTGAVVRTFTGFDSPFDVVFTPGGNFAVQQGDVSLRSIA